MKIAALAVGAIPVVVLISATLVELPKKLIYNGSASSPIGLYWIDDQPPKLGDFVLMNAPENVRKLIEIRQYLPPNMPMVKRVVGIGGDEICRRGRNILVNGTSMGEARSEDRFGRLLPVWRGCKTVSEGQILVLNVHPESFDGRYFGPVDRSLVIGRATWLGRPWLPEGPA